MRQARMIMKMGQAPIVLIGASPIFMTGTLGKPLFPRLSRCGLGASPVFSPPPSRAQCVRRIVVGRLAGIRNAQHRPPRTSGS